MQRTSNSSFGYRRRRFARRGGRFYKKVSKIAIKALKRNSEVKFTEFAFTGTDVNVGTYLTPLDFSFIQGTAKDQIIGKNIQYKNLSMKFSIFTRRTATAPSIDLMCPAALIRIVVFQARQANLAVGDVFFSNAFGSTLYSKVMPNACRVMKDELVPVILNPVSSPFASSVNTATWGGLPSAITRMYNFRINNKVNINTTTNKAQDPIDQYYMAISWYPLQANVADGNRFVLSLNGRCMISFYDV